MNKTITICIATFLMFAATNSSAQTFDFSAKKAELESNIEAKKTEANSKIDEATTSAEAKKTEATDKIDETTASINDKASDIKSSYEAKKALFTISE